MRFLAQRFLILLGLIIQWLLPSLGSHVSKSRLVTSAVTAMPSVSTPSRQDLFPWASFPYFLVMGTTTPTVPQWHMSLLSLNIYPGILIPTLNSKRQSLLGLSHFAQIFVGATCHYFLIHKIKI